ncbi:expressed protein [Phakopsora pachyrhizi]|uniref:Expressed protein n=1 Tax=Phakopsora pachyrhizi TaxID=170000 RepID=A0AAV0BW93_PHAPC|nr:expressed protein [Phakopsora pachyrhizi]
MPSNKFLGLLLLIFLSSRVACLPSLNSANELESDSLVEIKESGAGTSLAATGGDKAPRDLEDSKPGKNSSEPAKGAEIPQLGGLNGTQPANGDGGKTPGGPPPVTDSNPPTPGKTPGKTPDPPKDEASPPPPGKTPGPPKDGASPAPPGKTPSPPIDGASPPPEKGNAPPPQYPTTGKTPGSPKDGTSPPEKGNVPPPQSPTPGKTPGSPKDGILPLPGKTNGSYPTPGGKDGNDSLATHLFDKVSIVPTLTGLIAGSLALFA